MGGKREDTDKEIQKNKNTQAQEASDTVESSTDGFIAHGNSQQKPRKSFVDAVKEAVKGKVVEKLSNEATKRATEFGGKVGAKLSSASATMGANVEKARGAVSSAQNVYNETGNFVTAAKTLTGNVKKEAEKHFDEHFDKVADEAADRIVKDGAKKAEEMLRIMEQRAKSLFANAQVAAGNARKSVQRRMSKASSQPSALVVSNPTGVTAGVMSEEERTRFAKACVCAVAIQLASKGITFDESKGELKNAEQHFLYILGQGQGKGMTALVNEYVQNIMTIEKMPKQTGSGNTNRDSANKRISVASRRISGSEIRDLSKKYQEQMAALLEKVSAAESRAAQAEQERDSALDSARRAQEQTQAALAAAMDSSNKAPATVESEAKIIELMRQLEKAQAELEKSQKRASVKRGGDSTSTLESGEDKLSSAKRLVGSVLNNPDMKFKGKETLSPEEKAAIIDQVGESVSKMGVNNEYLILNMIIKLKAGGIKIADASLKETGGVKEKGPVGEVKIDNPLLEALQAKQREREAAGKKVDPDAIDRRQRERTAAAKAGAGAAQRGMMTNNPLLDALAKRRAQVAESDGEESDNDFDDKPKPKSRG